ncbi:MAG: hypothetical protein ACRDT8_00035 [Micromonosporaceae bacterium]
MTGAAALVVAIYLAFAVAAGALLFSYRAHEPYGVPAPTVPVTSAPSRTVPA